MVILIQEVLHCNEEAIRSMIVVDKSGDPPNDKISDFPH